MSEPSTRTDLLEELSKCAAHTDHAAFESLSDNGSDDDDRFFLVVGTDFAVNKFRTQEDLAEYLKLAIEEEKTIPAGYKVAIVYGTRKYCSKGKKKYLGYLDEKGQFVPEIPLFDDNLSMSVDLEGYLGAAPRQPDPRLSHEDDPAFDPEAEPF